MLTKKLECFSYFQEDWFEPIFCKPKLIPLKTVKMREIEKRRNENMERVKAIEVSFFFEKHIIYLFTFFFQTASTSEQKNPEVVPKEPKPEKPRNPEELKKQNELNKIDLWIADEDPARRK